ncbi:MAG TPA: MgtC/SapB family protein, partial [Pirellulales bacterium]
AILKSGEHQQVHGLTTASSIWLTAGLGTAAGIGRIWLTLFGSVLALIILALLRRFEAHSGTLPMPPSGRATDER